MCRSRHLSPFIAIYRHLSPFIAIYRNLSPFIAIYRHLSPFIVVYRLVSSFILFYRHLLSFIVFFRKIVLSQISIALKELNANLGVRFIYQTLNTSTATKNKHPLESQFNLESSGAKRTDPTICNSPSR